MDPRPLHLDIAAIAGGLLTAIAALLAATGHPLTQELLEALIGLIGILAVAASVIVGRVQAGRARREAAADRAAVKAGTEKAMEVLAVLRDFEPADYTSAVAVAAAARESLGDLDPDDSGRLTAPREPVPEEPAG